MSPSSEPTTAENQALRQTNWKSYPAWNQGSEFLSPGTFTATGQDKPLSLPDILLGAHKLPDICVHVSPRATRNRTFCRSSSALLGKADILGSAHPKRVRAKRVVTWPMALSSTCILRCRMGRCEGLAVLEPEPV